MGARSDCQSGFTKDQVILRILLTLCLSAGAISTEGCSGRSGSDSNTSGGSSGTLGPSTSSTVCVEQPTIDDCCCFHRPETGFGIDVTCDAADICPRIGIQCLNGLDECSVFSLPEEVACLLDALGKRRTGLLSWDKTSKTAPWGVDEPSESVRLYLNGDHGVLVRFDFGSAQTSISDVTRKELRPASFFFDCLSDPSLEIQMGCVEDAFLDSGDLCLDAYDYPRL